MTIQEEKQKMLRNFVFWKDDFEITNYDGLILTQKACERLSKYMEGNGIVIHNGDVANFYITSNLEPLIEEKE